MSWTCQIITSTRAWINAKSYVKACHVVRYIAEEMDQHMPRGSNQLWHPANRVPILSGHSWKNSDNIAENRITIENIEVISTAFSCKFFQMKPDIWVDRGRFNQPITFGVHGVLPMASANQPSDEFNLTNDTYPHPTGVTITLSTISITNPIWSAGLLTNDRFRSIWRLIFAFSKSQNWHRQN